MSTTTNNNVTATKNAYGLIMPEKKGSRPSTFTKSAWDMATYAVYMDLIHVVEGKLSIRNFMENSAPLFNACGMPADGYHFTSLVVAMARDTSVKGEKVRKVNAISSLRQFFNQGWVERENRQVVYNAPKAPATPKAPKPAKHKEPTKADLLKEIATLKAALGIAA